MRKLYRVNTQCLRIGNSYIARLAKLITYQSLLNKKHTKRRNRRSIQFTFRVQDLGLLQPDRIRVVGYSEEARGLYVEPGGCGAGPTVSSGAGCVPWSLPDAGRVPYLPQAQPQGRVRL